jgi:hypothetical protein
MTPQWPIVVAPSNVPLAEVPDVAAHSDSKLRFAMQRGVLQTPPDGRFLPWLGPALRGAVAAALKERVCRQPAINRNTQWRYCTGCEYHMQCAYGLTFESEPPRQSSFSGRDQASRAIVLAPQMVPSQPTWDGQLGFELLLIGDAAIAQRQEVLSSLAEAGRFRGLGLERCPFELIDLVSPKVGEVRAADLPASCDQRSGVVDRVTIRLTSPLFLKTANPRGRRRALEQPQFADLFRASLRAVGTLFALYAEPLDADFAGLKQAATFVECEHSAFVAFRQERHSNRTGQQFELRGILGDVTFCNVPWSLIPWLYWGGRFRMGQHRVTGAGGWFLELH